MKLSSLPRLAVFCSGHGSNFQAILDAVRKKKLRAQVAIMITDNPKAYAILRAEKARVPLVALDPKVFQTKQNYEKVLIEILKNQKVDLVVLAGFMRIFSTKILRAYRGRIINIHPSYLPHFKGAHAIRDAFQARVSETGVTVHFVSKKVDSGRIILQERVKILPKDTPASLEKRIHAVEHRLYPKAIQRVIDSKKR